MCCLLYIFIGRSMYLELCLKALTIIVPVEVVTKLIIFLLSLFTTRPKYNYNIFFPYFNFISFIICMYMFFFWGDTDKVIIFIYPHEYIFDFKIKRILLLTLCGL